MVKLFGKQNMSSSVRDTFTSKTLEKDDASGKILIEVNVSKQNMHDYEITQIIREIFELNKRDLSVEKVVMPIGENTWQIRKAKALDGRDEGSRHSVHSDLSRNSLHRSRSKIGKHGRLYRMKTIQGFHRAKKSSRKKLLEKHFKEPGKSDWDVPEVHSSSAITNLLSQLYPNPYNLIDLMEIRDDSVEARSNYSTENCKIKFIADHKSPVREKDENEPCHEPPAASGEPEHDGDKEPEKKSEKPFELDGSHTSDKVLRETVSQSEQNQGLKNDMIGDDYKRVAVEESNRVNHVSQSSKMTSAESKTAKKRIAKTWNAATEKVEGEKAQSVKSRMPLTIKEKVTLSNIHPMSLQKKNCSEKAETNDSGEAPEKRRKKLVSDKSKCVVKYLKLIKDMYEEEERQLQYRINTARNFAIDQMDGKKRSLRQGQNFSQQTDASFRNSHSQTPKIKSKAITEKGVCHLSENVPERKSPVRPVPVMAGDVPEPSCSRFTNPDNSSSIARKAPSRPLQSVGSVIQTDMVVLNRTNKSDALEVINTVQETNRKIDCLIRQIDNSMNWLSKSEKSDPSKINTLLENAKGLSQELEKNLKSSKDSLRLYENKNMSYNRSDILLSQSYHSLHIIPMENAIGRFRISADSIFNNGNRNFLWPNTVQPTPFNLFSPTQFARNMNRLASSGNNGETTSGNENRGRNSASLRVSTVEAEVPEFGTASSVLQISVEGCNELGSFTENVTHRESNESFKTRRKRDGSKFSLTEVKSALEAEEMMLNKYHMQTELESATPSFLSLDAPALYESPPTIKPVVIQEITWKFHLPAPLPVTHVLYRNELNLVFTRTEATVLCVAITASFLNLSLMNVVQVVEQEPKEQTSVIISLHRSSSFVKTNDGPSESSKMCEFVVLPSDANFTTHSSGNVDFHGGDAQDTEIKVLKKANQIKEKGFFWSSFFSESSAEICDEDNLDINRNEKPLQITNKNHSRNWLDHLPNPYKSNPVGEFHDEPCGTKNFHLMQTDPKKNEETALFHGGSDWHRGNIKFDSLPPSVFRYLSSETSSTSLDEKAPAQVPNLGKKLSRTLLFPSMVKNRGNESAKEETKIESLMEPKMEDKQSLEDDKDSVSTTSFKSSNDCSDISEFLEMSYPKKKARFLDMLFHELRSFRKSFERRKGPRRRTVTQDEKKELSEFKDALSDLETEKDDKEKQKIDEAVTVNTTCIDEIAIPASYSMPRKIFKTSFRGKESVTELMIDLKDVSISELSDISVEKRKLSTDHTKISIVISKQGSENCANVGDNTGKRKGSNDSEKDNFISWKSEDGNDSGEDADDDYKSVGSSIHGKSSENIPENKIEDKATKEELRKRPSPYGKHKFDFYKKMDDATPSFDPIKFNDRDIFFYGKYDKELAPLRKALTDMQFRVRNVHKNLFSTSDEYYERALRMAKMSAGYCQSCKSKTVIPEDPLGIYQKFIPRSFSRCPYGKHKYYFKTTSSTNSSFYSVRSSNSDIPGKFCHLNSSSSMVTNGMSRSRGSVFRENTDPTLPHFLNHTINS